MASPYQDLLQRNNVLTSNNQSVGKGYSPYMDLRDDQRENGSQVSPRNNTPNVNQTNPSNYGYSGGGYAVGGSGGSAIEGEMGQGGVRTSANPTGYTNEQIEQMLSQSLGNINEYYDKLNEIAKGDRDFVLKWIQKEFETALGTDDVARAEFLAKVASEDEKTNGRIPYDWEKYTQRQLEDYQFGIEGLDRVKKRLQEDYDATMQGKEIDWGEARQNQNESLTADNLMLGTRDQNLSQGGIAGQRMQKLESAITRERDLLNKEQERSLEDNELERKYLGIQNDRNIQDLNDKYRREAIDQMLSKDKQKETAEHNYGNTTTMNDINRDKEINQATAEADARKQENEYA